MRTALLTVVLALAAPAGAGAMTWSTPHTYSALQASCVHTHTAHPRDCWPTETAPRAAVNAHGEAVAAWVDAAEHVRVVVADRPGHFEAAQTLGRGLRPNVAVAADGTATVVWTAGSQHTNILTFSQRKPHHRFAAPRRLIIATAPGGNDDARLAVQRDGSVVVAFDSRNVIWALRISEAGTPGAVARLDTGRFDHDSVRANPDGTLAVCCLDTTPPAPHTFDHPTGIAVFRPGAGWRTLAPAVSADTNIETVAANRTTLVAGLIAVHTGGDAGALGVPGLLSTTGPANVFGPLLPAFVDMPSRGLQPVVAIDGSGGSVLLYQNKLGPEAFTRTAPIWSVIAAPSATRTPPRKPVYAGAGYHPAVRPLGRGAIAAWQDPNERWHVALEAGGVFAPAPAPSGAGPTIYGEDFNYDRDLATAGGYAVLAWTATAGRIRVSEIVG